MSWSLLVCLWETLIHTDIILRFSINQDFFVFKKVIFFFFFLEQSDSFSYTLGREVDGLEDVRHYLSSALCAVAGDGKRGLGRFERSLFF